MASEQPDPGEPASTGQAQAARLSLWQRSALLRWLGLIAASLVFVVLLELIRLPAALLLGPMVAGILFGVTGSRLAFPRTPYLIAQAIVGCMIARTLTLPVLAEIARDWPVFVAGVLSVVAASTVLGWVLAKLRVLPGSTAIWGSSPGAAQVMTLLSEHYGADMRLVAFMQYTRMIIVAAVAAGVARFFTDVSGQPSQAAIWLAVPDWASLAGTLALAVGSVIVGQRLPVPAASLMLPMVLGAILSDTGLLTIELPQPLLALAYLGIGWTIGLRFDRAVLAHAARATPRILLAIVCLVVLCAGFAAILVTATDLDPLSAYLATSPGGADTIAIIATSGNTDVNVAFVMAMQTARFIFIMLTGPALARFVAKRVSP